MPMKPIAIAAAFLAASPAFAAPAAGDCVGVLDATLRQLTTPSRAKLTEKIGGKTESMETIYTGDAMYMQYDGTWKKSRMTPAATANMKRANVADATTFECKHLRDESVGGEAAAVYATKTNIEDVKADGTIWISTSRKLPLRIETLSDAGTPDERAATIVYEYGDVKAPIP